MARIFITLIVLFLLQSNAQAQVPVPLKLSIERDTRYLLIMNKPSPEDFNPLIYRDNDTAVPMKIVTMTSVETEYQINKFFENEASKCSGKFHFGVYPVPGGCYQSKDKRTQFLGFTTWGKTEVLFRYNFYSVHSLFE
ncbi:MAG: hypothetical protein WCK60_00435 [Candidatus Nomurabacteria bacterium]